MEHCCNFFYHIYLFLYKFESLPHLKLPICFLKHRCTIQHSSLVLHAFLLVHSHTQRFVLAVPIYFTRKDPSGLNTIYNNLPITQIAGLQVQKWKKVDNSCFFFKQWEACSIIFAVHPQRPQQLQKSFIMGIITCQAKPVSYYFKMHSFMQNTPNWSLQWDPQAIQLIKEQRDSLPSVPPHLYCIVKVDHGNEEVTQRSQFT